MLLQYLLKPFHRSQLFQSGATEPSPPLLRGRIMGQGDACRSQCLSGPPRSFPCRSGALNQPGRLQIQTAGFLRDFKTASDSPPHRPRPSSIEMYSTTKVRSPTGSGSGGFGIRA
jgi:hypothetical protein